MRVLSNIGQPAQLGMVGDDIVRLKEFLASVGFDPGNRTNYFDNDTQERLRMWQAHNGLGLSGMWTRVEENFLASQDPAAEEGFRIALERYGPGFAMLSYDPELGPIIAEAARDGRDENWLRGQIQQTQYWIRTSAAQRAWDQLNMEDRGQADYQRRIRGAEVQDLVERLGLRPYINPQNQGQIIEDSLRNGWAPEQLVDALVVGSQFIPRVSEQGMMGSGMQEARRAAAKWLVSISDEEAFDYSRRMAAGELRPEDIEVAFRQRARDVFAQNQQIVEMIDAGFNVGDYFNEHRNQIAQLLEVDASTIDLRAPQWQEVLNHRDDTGVVRPMTSKEAATLARNQPGWANTQNGKQTITQMFNGVKGFLEGSGSGR